jgi:hypothetical protein
MSYLTLNQKIDSPKQAKGIFESWSNERPDLDMLYFDRIKEITKRENQYLDFFSQIEEQINADIANAGKKFRIVPEVVKEYQVILDSGRTAHYDEKLWVSTVISLTYKISYDGLNSEVEVRYLSDGETRIIRPYRDTPVPQDKLQEELEYLVEKLKNTATF